MGYIQTEIQMDGKKLSFETDSNGLYQLNCLSHSHIINTSDKILSILIIKDMIILLTEDRDFRNGALQAPFYKDDRRTNNMDAYAWNGKHLWNIGDIVGDIKTPFTGVSLTAGENNSECSADLLICFAGDYRFVIDPIEKSVISKISGKW
ncbi:MAG: hypothetical protein IKM00_04685 [Clostridia bacterium]|nr:hypothetical protein [Clostridia bacterium]